MGKKVLNMPKTYKDFRKGKKKSSTSTKHVVDPASVAIDPFAKDGGFDEIETKQIIEDFSTFILQLRKKSRSGKRMSWMDWLDDLKDLLDEI